MCIFSYCLALCKTIARVRTELEKNFGHRPLANLRQSPHCPVVLLFVILP